MFTLVGNHPQDGCVEVYFTANEQELAMQVAQKWLYRGYCPHLYSFDGVDFKTHLSWQQNRTQRLAA